MGIGFKSDEINISDRSSGRIAHQARQRRDLLPEGAPVLAICPSASMPYKVWPGTRFAELVKRLIAPGGAMAGARVPR